MDLKNPPPTVILTWHGALVTYYLSKKVFAVEK